MGTPLEDKIDALITTLNNTVGKVTAPAGKEITANAVGGFVSSVVDSTTKLMTGTYSLSAGLSDVAGTLGKLGGPIAEQITNIVKEVGESAIHINKALNEVAGSGVNFGNNIGKFTEDVVSARMSIPEFARIIAENGNKIAGLGGSAQAGTNALLAIGKEFAETPAVRQLNAVGVGMEELNKVLVLSAVSRRHLDMNNAVTQQRVADAAADLANEMDNVARLTGVSRQQQEKQIQDQMKKAEVEIMLASMSEEQITAYTQNTAALGTYGKEFQDVLTIYTTGGVRNAEDNMKVAALGPKFAGLLEEMSKIKGDTVQDNEARRRIQAEINAESVRLIKDKDEMALRAAGATSMGEFGRAQASATQSVLRHGASLLNAERSLAEENAKREATGKSAITALEFANEQVIAEAEAKKAALTSLEPGAIINRTEALIKDISAGASAGLNDLNTGAKKAATGMEGFNKLLEPLTKEDVILRFKTFIAEMSKNAVDEGKLSPAAKADAAAAKAKTDGKAEGGGMFGNTPYLVGEAGPEIGSFNKDSNLLSNKNLRSLFGEADTDLRNATSSLQSEMRSKIADLKSSTLTAGQLEEAMSRVTAALPKQLPQMPQDNTASNELIKHVQLLNTQVRELITAVVEGSSANVKAVRTSGGNILA